jgi:sodium-coupled monocarboxylate transporter 8/12
MTVIDGLIIAVYLIAIVAVGILYRGRQDNIGDYFTSSHGFRGRIGTIMVGLSIGATMFSGLSFVAYPSIVYTYGVTVLSGIAFFPVAYLILRFWFLPRYLSVPQNSPYDIIERRMGKPVRLVASVMFVMLRVGWMSALIFAPVIVVTAVTGLGDEWFWPLVALIGLSSTVYTVVGGIRGVIVTDAIQFLLIIAVLAATILFVVLRIPLSFGEVTHYLRTNGDLLRFNWSLNPTQAMTVWAIAVGGGFQNMSSFTSDQMSLQRYLATGEARPASSAFGTSILTTILVLLMLSAVGLTIGAWYSVHPAEDLPVNPDRVFPYFVATQLPIGFAGIVIAALLAATMSSITSGINALSGSLLNDFVLLQGRVPPKRLLNYARLTSACIGVAATIGAGLVDRIGSLFDIMQVLYGVFLGPLLGCMISTIFRLKVRGSIMIVALICGCLSGVWVAYSSVSNLWVSMVSCLVTLFMAFGVGRLVPRPPNVASAGQHPDSP